MRKIIPPKIMINMVNGKILDKFSGVYSITPQNHIAEISAPTAVGIIQVAKKRLKAVILFEPLFSAIKAIPGPLNIALTNPIDI